MPKKKVAAIYPGSFDPFTLGHLDVLKRSLELFSPIRLVVARAAQKKVLFSIQKRVRLIQEVVQAIPEVEVDQWDGLMIEYAKKQGISVLIRGLRAASDFEYEFMMASMNKELAPHVETVFMMTSKDLYFISSTMVKEVARFGGNVRAYVPKSVAQVLESKTFV